MNNIGTKIMLLRKQNNMSQTDLAKKLNVSNKLISKWETGGSLPSTEYLPKLCQIFNVKINELMGEEDFPKIKSKKKVLKLTVIISSCIVIFCLFATFFHFTLASAMLKKPFVNDIDKHIEKTFSGSHYYLTTTVEIDDVPTITEEYGYVNNGKVEYVEYLDNKLQTIIKDGVKYDAETDKREIFDNSQIKNIWELYEYSGEEEKDFEVFGDVSFINYIYKQFNGYYFEVNKGVINRFIDEELDSDVRVTSKIKADVDFSKGKFKTMTMSFKAKSNNVPIDVKITQKFNLTKAKQTIKFPDDINSKQWNNVELKLVDDLLQENKLEKLDIQLPNLFKSNNNIVSYDMENIYLYSENLELIKTINIHDDINMNRYVQDEDFYFNVVNNYVFIKEDDSSFSDLYVLKLETEEWFKATNIWHMLYVSPSLKIYYKNQYLYCYDLISETTINLKGDKFVAEIGENIYTCNYNDSDYEKGVYKYNNGTTEKISDRIIDCKCYTYNNLIFAVAHSYYMNYNCVFNENFESINALPFSSEQIVFNQDNIFCVGYPSKYSVGCKFYNYDNLFVPPLRLNIEYVVAFEDYYLAKKVGENTLYKIYADYLNELGGW